MVQVGLCVELEQEHRDFGKASAKDGGYLDLNGADAGASNDPPAGATSDAITPASVNPNFGLDGEIGFPVEVCTRYSYEPVDLCWLTFVVFGIHTCTTRRLSVCAESLPGPVHAHALDR